MKLEEVGVRVGKGESRRRERGGRVLEGGDRSWSCCWRCRMVKGSRKVVAVAVVVVVVGGSGCGVEVAEEVEEGEDLERPKGFDEERRGQVRRARPRRLRFN